MSGGAVGTISETFYSVLTSNVDVKTVAALEISQYLEKQLWPSFDPEASSYEHLMSILVMVNEKMREGVAAWDALETRPEVFTKFLERVLRLKLWDPIECTLVKNGNKSVMLDRKGTVSEMYPSYAHHMSPYENLVYLEFMCNAFQSLERDIIREKFLPLVGLPLWLNVASSRIVLELRTIKTLSGDLHDKLSTRWEKTKERYAKWDKDFASKVNQTYKSELGSKLYSQFAHRSFLPALIEEFFMVLETVQSERVDGVTLPPTWEAAGSTLDRLKYLEWFVELLCTLLSQLATRRFFWRYFMDSHVTSRCVISPIFGKTGEYVLFNELLHKLKYYEQYEVNNYTGSTLTETQISSERSERLSWLQRVAYKYYKAEVGDFALQHHGALSDRTTLTGYLNKMKDSTLKELCQRLALLPEAYPVLPTACSLVPSRAESLSALNSLSTSRRFLTEVLASAHEHVSPQMDLVDSLSLYPTEDLMWYSHLVPEDVDYLYERRCTPLPKLNLQFLVYSDYFLRNLHLYRLESAYEIRQDLADVVERMNPVLNEKWKTVMKGTHRMSVELPAGSLKVVNVGRPAVGRLCPAHVKAEIRLDLGNIPIREVRADWEALRPHDLLFMMHVEMTRENMLALQRAASEGEQSAVKFTDKYGIKLVRGAEIYEIADAGGHIFDESKLGRPDYEPLRGTIRVYKILLDENQFYQDMRKTAQASVKSEAQLGAAFLYPTMSQSTVSANMSVFVGDAVINSNVDADAENAIRPSFAASVVDLPKTNVSGAVSMYERCNILVRRRPEEGNFKAVLTTIRDCMHEKAPVPQWLHDLLLGYGDPKQASADALALAQASVGQDKVLLDKKRQITVDMFDELFATLDPHPQNDNPYVSERVAKTIVPFTPVQAQAVSDAMKPGLHLVVGPPGTGKTDVAVQVLNDLFHEHPTQRILLVAQSNYALNQLFEKIIATDIDEGRVIRMGHGQELLETVKDFSKWGRVDYLLTRRLELLEKIARLASSVGVLDPGWASSCQAAQVFFTRHILPRYNAFKTMMQDIVSGGVKEVNTPELVEQGYKLGLIPNPVDPNMEVVGETEEPEVVTDEDKVMAHKDSRTQAAYLIRRLYPFAAFFADVPNLFTGDIAHDWDMCEKCFKHIMHLIKELREIGALETLRTTYDRTTFFISKYARIIAMTCTHAALKRDEFLKLAFSFDSMVMEESGHVLDIEAVIPMLLQKNDPEHARLARVVLIGDHRQLPPVVKNSSLQVHCHFDQSLFTRLIKLGVPHIQLNMQGRCRPSIAKLFSWNYTDLGNLPRTQTNEYLLANPGFAYDFQLINVDDFGGRGEACPMPHYYQNLGEAEYVVAVYQYMRLLGYPLDSIVILTPYQGQRQLIHGLLVKRCQKDPLFGPRIPKVSTVDQYQGQQNDYVLLSMVRTKAVGHIRDPRRLVVAMSRARLGMYVFCRQKLFSNVREIAPSFNLLNSRSSKLHLLPMEAYPPTRPADAAVTVAPLIIQDVQHMGAMVNEMATHTRQMLISTLEERFEKQKREDEEKRKEEQARLEEIRRREAESEEKPAEEEGVPLQEGGTPQAMQVEVSEPKQDDDDVNQ